MPAEAVQLLALEEYDHVIVAFSGGKDSLACLLYVMGKQGLFNGRIECWHHDVDGHEDPFMDWPITPDYCRKVCEHLATDLRFSWRQGGFLREMMRDVGSRTAPTFFETPGGLMSAGGKGPLSTKPRLKFPQISADLSVRWCSAYLKIDVGRRAFNNDPRFVGKKTLFVTGERAEESTARSKYLDAEDHDSSSQSRLIHQWRPVLHWKEQQVWDIIAKWKINPHPGYRLGWGRISCQNCIFMDKDQAAASRELDPESFERLARLEKQFGFTIKQGVTLNELADKGTSFLPLDPALRALALSKHYTDSVTADPWVLPPGAFKRAGGPS